MNTNRLLGEGKSSYHCVLRTVDRTYVFLGSEEKEVCRKIMRKLENLLHEKLRLGTTYISSAWGQPMYREEFRKYQ